MDILVTDIRIVAHAPHIEFGTFENEKKWGLFDKSDVLTRAALLYVIDYGCTLVKNVELPDDYVDGKYFFENGEFILNEKWKPYRSPEQRIAELEEENARLTQENLESMEIEADLLYDVSMIQLGLA